MSLTMIIRRKRAECNSRAGARRGLPPAVPVGDAMAAAVGSRPLSVIDSLPTFYRLPFAACYVYSPKGYSDISAQSRLLCARVKAAHPKWIDRCAARVRSLSIRDSRFARLLDRQTVLVPVPTCESSEENTLWAAREVASAINASGLARGVWTGLVRVVSVERSSRAWMWHRPTVVQHYESLAVLQRQISVTRIVLIDDVVTKGRTLIAAALRLHQAFPHAHIQAFALVRTLGFVSEIERLVEPCWGEIRWNGVDAYREP